MSTSQVETERLTVGFVGLGRMGANMVKRMLQSGNINVIVSNRSQGPIDEAISQGAESAKSLEELIQKLPKPRIVWLMLPAGAVTEDHFQRALDLLDTGDILVEGANSNFHDTIRRHEEAKAKGISMLDVGVSGGVVAVNTGYPMMIGGTKETFEKLAPVFKSFGIEHGYDLVGPGGAGHYVKMIHNAIEYGMMHAIGEGFDLLENGRIKNLNLEKIAGIWNRGTIVSSFLMQMTHQALQKDKELSYLQPYIDDSGEGKWSAIEALEYNVPFVVNSYALNARFASRDENSYAYRLVAAMRNEFGAHPIKKK